MSNWIKAETSKMCPVMSSELRGNIYFGSYVCLKCDYNLGYDKEAGLIKCAKESEIWPDLRENLRKDLRKDEAQQHFRRRIAFLVFIVLSILFLFCVFVKHYIL
jgi:hypothetical protein